MTVNDSWNVAYEVRAEGVRQGFESKEDAIEYAKSIEDRGPLVYAVSAHIDEEGYEDEKGEETLVWSPEEGDIDVEDEDPGAAWKKRAAERKPVEWDVDEIMGISEWDEGEGRECRECDPLDCFCDDDGRFSDREGNFVGSPLSALDPDDLLSSLVKELNIDPSEAKVEIELEWPKPEAEEEEKEAEEPEGKAEEGGDEKKVELVVKAEVPEEVADGIKDDKVDVKVEKEGEIPEISGENVEISEISEKPEEREEGEKIEESIREGADVEAALKCFSADLDEDWRDDEKDMQAALDKFKRELEGGKWDKSVDEDEEDDMTDLELAEKLAEHRRNEFAERRRQKPELKEDADDNRKQVEDALAEFAVML